MSKELGFRQEGIISLVLPLNDTQNTQYLKNEISRFPEVTTVSAHLGSPIARTNNTNTLVFKGKDEKEHTISVNFKNVDEDYFSLFDLEILAGENIFKDEPDNVIVVNESFIKEMGIENPAEAIGKSIKAERFNANYRIKGVVEDFHANSLHSSLSPVAFSYNENYFYEIAIRLNSTSQASISSALDRMSKTWNSVYPEYIMNYDFLDDLVASNYEAEKRGGKLLRLFAFLVIVIGSLGLYGLVDFMAMKKTKEIGIRKVLGASSMNILRIFVREISISVFISLAIAGPVMYFLLGKWLNLYAYRISIGWEVFALALLSVLVVATGTTGYRSLKASNLNPVDTLKDE